MTPFTTSKGDFIAVPVPDGSHSFKLLVCSDGDLLVYYTGGNKWIAYEVTLPRLCEIIGLSSDILKDEELAKKVIVLQGDDFDLESAYTEFFKSILDLRNITGNNLIIKKK